MCLYSIDKKHSKYTVKGVNNCDNQIITTIMITVIHYNHYEIIKITIT